MRSLVLSLMMAVSVFAGNDLKIQYTVDVTKFDADSFFVTMAVSGYKADSAVFQFASTAPGTYQVMDVGRFVENFRAFDASGKMLTTVKAGTNQYVIRDAKKLASVSYRVDDSFGSPIEENKIYPMCGSNLERNNILVNGQMVFGFFKGYQANPIQVRFLYPKEWKVGTALNQKGEWFTADTYDHLVDSPVMLGTLTSARTKLGGADVELYCYSPNAKQNADSVLTSMKAMLSAAEKFLGALPVKRYVFLYHFRDDIKGAYGAWEHSYSSEYVMPEDSPNEEIVSVASHEFFHIVTPLNIHSEIIESFNFEKPTASQHLWLYEGTTEWAAQMMQIRGGLIPEGEFYKRMAQKITYADYFRPDVSLVALSLGSYDSTAAQYGNIYMKGALTAMMLDLRLLELSKGKKGWNEVIKELSKEYGPKRAFPEKQFFDIVVKKTYPEIGDFLNRYVKNAEPLPYKDYLAKAGLVYEHNFNTGVTKTDFGVFGIDAREDGRIFIKDADTNNAVNRQLGIRPGDQLLILRVGSDELKVGGGGLFSRLGKLKDGEAFEWVVQRGTETLTLKAKAGTKTQIVPHHIAPMPNATKEQLEFRATWLSNRS